MTSPSDLALLRTYLPEDLIDTLHELAYNYEVPVRWVVRAVLELGLPRYLDGLPTDGATRYEDELSSRTYQSNPRRPRTEQARAAREWRGVGRGSQRGDLHYDEPPPAGGRT